MPNVLDGISVKMLPDGNLSLLIHPSDLLKSLENAPKAHNGCILAIARRTTYPLKGYTHQKPVLAQLKEEKIG